MTSPRHHPEGNRFQQWLRVAGMAFSAMTLLLLIILFALWQYRTPLLNNIAKPYLEQFLSKELEAVVTIERLELDRGQLRVRGMAVNHADAYGVTVSAVLLDFNIAKLLRGRLSSLRVEQPEIYLTPAFLPGDGGSTPITLRKPPVSIDLLQVVSGRFDLVLPDQVVEIRAIEFSMSHAPSGDFHLSLTVQGDAPLNLYAIGLLQWQTTPELQIDEMNIDGRTLLAAPMTIRPATGGLAIGGELMLTHFDRAQLEPWLALAGVQQSFPADLDFSVENLRLAVEISSGQVQGQMTADALQLITDGFRTQVNNLQLKGSGTLDQWHAAGEALLAEGSPLSFAVQSENDHIVATAQGTFLNFARVPEVLGKGQALPVNGGLQWVARATWRDEILALSGDFLGLSPESSTSTDYVNLSLLRGKFQLTGALDQLRGKVTLDLEEKPLLKLEGGSDQLIVELHRTSVSSLAKIVDPSLWPQVVENRGWIAGKIQFQPAPDNLNGRFEFTAESLHAAGFEFGTSRISSQFSWQQEQLALTDLSIHSATSGHGVSIPVATLQGSAHWRSPELSLNIAALNIDNLEYLSADNMSALAGGSLAFAGIVAWDVAQQRLRFSLQGSAQVQEALAHAFYGDLSQLPMDVHLQADWNTVAESLQVDEIKLSLPDIGQLKGHGNWSHDALEFGGEFQFPQLENGFNQHLRPLLASLSPELEHLDLSGTLAAVGEGVFAAGGWRIAGALRPDTIGLKYRTANMSMSNLSGEIPFAFSSNEEVPASARSGFVTFAQLETGSVVSEVNYLTFTSSTNRLTFVDPWKLNLAGGRILIENLSFGQKSAELFVSGRTHIDNIDLQQLTHSLELTPMNGSMTADLGEFEYSGGLLQSEGEARIDVFGGTIQIRNLKARDIFSSYRSFEGDIDFHGIDLEQLTQTFEFGEINGIVDGYIHELRLFGKVPSAFVAEIATRDQGERNISVKALNNLTVISQGGLSAALSRGVYQFIDFYRYRKIGLFCALRNDVFVLKGTARSDSDLHLVDGGFLPPRINVLAPGTGVSFREMLRRLERIDRTATR